MKIIYSIYMSYSKLIARALPKKNVKPNKETGKIYSSIYFLLILPCFNELYELFYVEGKKNNSIKYRALFKSFRFSLLNLRRRQFCRRDRAIRLYTQCFSLKEVVLLVKVLTDKFNLKCTINKNKNGFIIRISSKSLPILQALLKDIMPPMKLNKIGL
jgi:LAGLIDADG DNA endonuclease family